MEYVLSRMTHRARRQPAKVAAAACALLAVLLLLLAAFLWMRRLAGAFDAPLSFAALLLITLALSAIAAVPRAAWRLLARPSSSPLQQVWPLAALTPGLLLMVAAISLPATSLAALGAAWFLLAIGEAAWWAAAARPFVGRSGNPGSTRTTTLRDGELPPERLANPPLFDGELPPHVDQQITRRREQEHVVIEGRLRAVFSPGERTQNLHVVFCPPLDDRPEFFVEQASGPNISLKAAEVESYGARLELRLSRSAVGGEQVVLQFLAQGK